MTNDDLSTCPDSVQQTWELLVEGAWQQDNTAKVLLLLALLLPQVVCDPSHCCSSLLLSSTGQAASQAPDLMGQYTKVTVAVSSGSICDHPSLV